MTLYLSYLVRQRILSFNAEWYAAERGQRKWRTPLYLCVAPYLILCTVSPVKLAMSTIFFVFTLWLGRNRLELCMMVGMWWTTTRCVPCTFLCLASATLFRTGLWEKMAPCQLLPLMFYSEIINFDILRTDRRGLWFLTYFYLHWSKLPYYFVIFRQWICTVILMAHNTRPVSEWTRHTHTTDLLWTVACVQSVYLDRSCCKVQFLLTPVYPEEIIKCSRNCSDTHLPFYCYKWPLNLVVHRAIYFTKSLVMNTFYNDTTKNILKYCLFNWTLIDS